VSKTAKEGSEWRLCSPRNECLGLVDVGRAECAKLGNLETLEVGEVTLLDGPAQSGIVVSPRKASPRDAVEGSWLTLALPESHQPR